MEGSAILECISPWTGINVRQAMMRNLWASVQAALHPDAEKSLSLMMLIYPLFLGVLFSFIPTDYMLSMYAV